MNHRDLFSRITTVLAVLLMFAGCNRTRENQPVTTTTDKGTTTAPSSEQAERRDKALVRVISAAARGQRYDVYVGDNKVFTSINYKTVTAYKEVSGTVRTLKVRPAGQESVEPLAQNTEMMMDGNYYTAVVMPEKDGKGVRLNVYSDNLVVPSADKTKVRVINASPDVGDIDIYVKGRDKALFSGVGFASANGYDEVEPITGALEARLKGKKGVVASVPNTRFDAGKLYTVVITGRLPKLEAIPVEDQLAGATVTDRRPAGAATPRSSTARK
jgi:Domain of unknown function (DUF4397)